MRADTDIDVDIRTDGGIDIHIGIDTDIDICYTPTLKPHV